MREICSSGSVGAPGRQLPGSTRMAPSTPCPRVVNPVARVARAGQQTGLLLIARVKVTPRAACRSKLGVGQTPARAASNHFADS